MIFAALIAATLAVYAQTAQFGSSTTTIPITSRITPRAQPVSPPRACAGPSHRRRRPTGFRTGSRTCSTSSSSACKAARHHIDERRAARGRGATALRLSFCGDRRASGPARSWRSSSRCIRCTSNRWRGSRSGRTCSARSSGSSRCGRTCADGDGALRGVRLGLMSKPMIVTLPFVLLLLDLWPLKRGLRSAKSSRYSRSRRPARRSLTWRNGQRSRQAGRRDPSRTRWSRTASTS